MPPGYRQTMITGSRDFVDAPFNLVMSIIRPTALCIWASPSRRHAIVLAILAHLHRLLYRNSRPHHGQCMIYTSAQVPSLFTSKIKPSVKSRISAISPALSWNVSWFSQYLHIYITSLHSPSTPLITSNMLMLRPSCSTSQQARPLRLLSPRTTNTCRFHRHPPPEGCSLLYGLSVCTAKRRSYPFRGSRQLCTMGTEVM